MRKGSFPAWIGLVCLLILSSCQSPVASAGGSLTVTLGDGVSRTLTPSISMVPLSYDLSGTGPSGATFAATVANGASTTQTALAFGEWTVSATAKNASGVAIGVGSGTVTVHSNATANLAITVRPYAGFGALDLSVDWTANQVDLAQVVASLLPSVGTVRPLSFTVDAPQGIASFSATDVPTGYHTLSLQLKDNGALTMGAVEVVRIVKDQTTTGAYHFSNLNQATGGLQVNLTPDMADPLTVTIGGGAAAKPANQSLELSATVAETEVNATFVWYVNGEAVATGAAWTMDDSWAQGHYRIDVTAFSADGSRAGSASAIVVVGASEAGGENYTSANIGTLVYVPAGSFQRDAAASNISVITQPYRMSANEITRAQFANVMGTDPSLSTYSSGTSDPVQKTNWYHAIAFCNKLSLAEGLTPVYSVVGVDFSTLIYAAIPTDPNATWDSALCDWSASGYRLPTEMEWMWAAMGASGEGLPAETNTTGYLKAFAGSTGSNSIGDYAWYKLNVTDGRSQPVGGKAPNELGLFDMSGNILEWNWDYWEPYPAGTLTDFAGAVSGTRRVLHGGVWTDVASYCAVASRDGYGAAYQSAVIGFRVVRR